MRCRSMVGCRGQLGSARTLVAQADGILNCLGDGHGCGGCGCVGAAMAGGRWERDAGLMSSSGQCTLQTCGRGGAASSGQPASPRLGVSRHVDTSTRPRTRPKRDITRSTPFTVTDATTRLGRVQREAEEQGPSDAHISHAGVLCLADDSTKTSRRPQCLHCLTARSTRPRTATCLCTRPMSTAIM